ncbi:MAG: hypothetical protein WAQ98_12545 [Blastocatellia bacterium]
MLNKKFKKTFNIKGFSLVELLVTTVVFIIVVVLSGQLIRLANFDSQVNTNLNEVQQNSRVALKFLERDVTNSGDSYLIGIAGGLGIVGPSVSLNAFEQIRGTNPTNTATNVPTPSDNKQPLFSLFPVRRATALGNGADGGGQTALENGSADKLTIAYEDEFFLAGSEQGFQDVARTIPLPSPDDTAKSLSADVEFQGVWNRTNSTLNLGDPDPVSPAGQIFLEGQDDMGNPIYFRRVFDTSTVRVGDIFKLTGGSNSQSVVLAVVSNVTATTLEFAPDVIGFNKKTSNINAVIANINSLNAQIGALDPVTATAAIAALEAQKDAALSQVFPLDLLPEVPGDPAGGLVTATRIMLYTYMVDPLTQDLVRRRYTYQPEATGTLGDAFVNDPVCQNVERFWVSFKLFVPSTSTDPARLSNDIELDPSTDTNDFAALQNIRLVNINLILRSTEIDRRNAQPARFGIQASFAPRNIVYRVNQNAS